MIASSNMTINLYDVNYYPQPLTTINKGFTFPSITLRITSITNITARVASEACAVVPVTRWLAPPVVCCGLGAATSMGSWVWETPSLAFVRSRCRGDPTPQKHKMSLMTRICQSEFSRMQAVLVSIIWSGSSFVFVVVNVVMGRRSSSSSTA